MIVLPLVIMEFNNPRHNTICLPFPSEATYRKLIAMGITFRYHLDKLIAQHLEIFQKSRAKFSIQRY